ncbi:ABC transporter permease [Ciceribacter sp. L1K22]|uniref:ABC transporter permease n=1 Tax=Ciceribacter sp. L1K22 TaxID=2820275 RepID=UPI001ABE45D3|nr:ABC transporter permease [Ciceribacter sp. L1K22]MBO3762514.1 ABC transporter permease [Ciceribacter sp. L1K22]
MRKSLALVPVSFRIALREMRGGLSGFYIFLACIALGTAAIAAVNSVSSAITASITSEGRTLLAGDIRFELNNREASQSELAFLQKFGAVSQSVGLRSMARLPDGTDQSLVELKAVDESYPLYGELTTEPAGLAASLFAPPEESTYTALVAPLLLDRMGLSAGDHLLIGDARFRIAAAVVTEPDALSEGFGFAPRLMTSLAGLRATGLLQTGSLVEYTYKIRLSPSAPSIEDIREASQKDFPNAGWSIRSSDRAAPSLTENVQRFSQFLTLVGLTALVVGGVGVANAVRAFLDSKRTVIATLKCVGAPAGAVVMVYFFQIAFIALVGIVIGLVVGAAAPMLAMPYLARFLPISAGPELHGQALVLAALFGILTTLAFAIIPLGHARKVPATALFREHGTQSKGLPSWSYLTATAVTLLALATLAIWSAEDRFLALLFVGSMAVVFAVLRFVAWIVTEIARRAPTTSSAALRLAIGNIHRPGALTASVVLSLGLGLSLLVTLALIDGNLRRELTGNLSERAPNFFFVDLQRDQLDQFRALISEKSPTGVLAEVPMLRGRILELNGMDVTKIDVPPEGRWVLRGDRGITYSEKLPENASLTQGSWWPENYQGEPLVSFSEEEATELGLKLGDTVTVNVLGRSLTVKIANFRKVEWESLSINFVMVFSPNTFAGAPHAWLATLTDPTATAEQEADILRSVTNTLPTVTTVRVKDALDTVNRLVAQLAIAIRAAASVALVASILVLSGALAAGNKARARDAVILKTLGATRVMLIRAFSYEYLLLGAATAAFALLAGGVAAWFIVSKIMNLPATFLPSVAIGTLLVAMITTIVVGLIGTWRILGQKAAPVLREL